jgi:hypothetical protein
MCRPNDVLDDGGDEETGNKNCAHLRHRERSHEQWQACGLATDNNVSGSDVRGQYKP